MKTNIISIGLLCSIGCGYIENPNLVGDDLGASSGESSSDSEATSGTTEGVVDPPAAPVLVLSFSRIKQFDFTWWPAAGADYYQLFESADQGEPFVQVGGDLIGLATSLTVPLHFRAHASYKLAACNAGGCTDSEVVPVVGSLAEAVGYFKAANTDMDDTFGVRVALSADGSTLAVGAWREDSNAEGIDGNQADNTAEDAGAVYVFERNDQDQWSQAAYVKPSTAGASDLFGSSVTLSADGNTLAVGAYAEAQNAGAVYMFERDGQGQWSQAAYVKPLITGAGDGFGASVALSADGSTLAVGANGENSNAVGIGGDQADNSADNAGAVYVFERDGQGEWNQAAYVKASNTGAGDYFGYCVALNGDGSTLAVGAYYEASSAMGVDGNQADDTAPIAGAVYVFGRNGLGQWSQNAYVKASNTDAGDRFGVNVALSADASTLAVGAFWEDSNATGIDGSQDDQSASAAGAVYVFERVGQGPWGQTAYVKASNTGAGDKLGYGLALSADASTLAVGAYAERSNAVGIDGNQTDDSTSFAGAVYVFARDGQGQWGQAAYVKASNPDADDQFGYDLALSGDGNTLAVGAWYEDSDAVGIGNDQSNDAAPDAGAVYLY